MKRSTKIISIVLIFFFIITAVIVARTMIGNHFKKKFRYQAPWLKFYELLENSGLEEKSSPLR